MVAIGATRDERASVDHEDGGHLAAPFVLTPLGTHKTGPNSAYSSRQLIMQGTVLKGLS